MAYGQTGSGKTHTMVGDHSLYDDLFDNKEESKEGIIPRSAKEILRSVLLFILFGLNFLKFQEIF